MATPAARVEAPVRRILFATAPKAEVAQARAREESLLAAGMGLLNFHRNDWPWRSRCTFALAVVGLLQSTQALLGSPRLPAVNLAAVALGTFASLWCAVHDLPYGCCYVLRTRLGEHRNLTRALLSSAACMLLGVDPLLQGSPPNAALMLVMQLLAAVQARTACTNHQTKRSGSPLRLDSWIESDSSQRSRGQRQQISASLPRGWRYRREPDGSQCFEHKRTGRKQWHMPQAHWSPPLYTDLPQCPEEEEGLLTPYTPKGRNPDDEKLSPPPLDRSASSSSTPRKPTGGGESFSSGADDASAKPSPAFDPEHSPGAESRRARRLATSQTWGGRGSPTAARRSAAAEEEFGELYGGTQQGGRRQSRSSDSRMNVWDLSSALQLGPDAPPPHPLEVV